ncbi:hypothetical protein VB780_06730 [Leptolyngbya sp. CCNP1308]|uniref:hypothetical protein n=1 Tax=Leptolyngbya sp. CCNP1308 TaxID=3110255 RepID=UPI002B21D0E7|nr:hypothetical protein [Leptolyngbya sp. CCNP1308]MEA5448254.1 hypothetical protein [Leptolyngbya sp. CCNP1308]
MSQTDPFGSPGQPDRLSPEWLELLYSVCPTLPEYDSGPGGKSESVTPFPANDPFWDQAAALGYDRPDAEPVFYPPVSDVLMTSFLDSVFDPPSVDP